jgi:HAMP domain-containing protein
MARAPFRIRTRLLQGFLAIVALMTAAAGVILVEGRAMDRAFVVQDRLCRAEIELLECRRQEKNFILRHDQVSLDAFVAAQRAITDETHALLLEIPNSRLRAELERLHDAVQEYGTVFSRAASGQIAGEGTSDDLEALVVPLARECHELVHSLRGAATARFRRAAVTTGAVSVAAVLAGLVLSLVVVLLLTRSIVTPLERLRQLAERASTGDLQDIDVAFRCHRFERSCSRECLDLADSVRRMMTSIRLLVPTEQGLMSNFQMAILVLVNRAVGPAGRAVVDRSLHAAGFSSFSEVGPATVEQFLSALSDQVKTSIPRENLELLCQAIRDLALEPNQHQPWMAFFPETKR